MSSSSELVRNPLQLATAAARLQARDDSTDSPAPTPDDERKDVEAALQKFNEESDSSEEDEEEQHVHHTCVVHARGSVGRCAFAREGVAVF